MTDVGGQAVHLAFVAVEGDGVAAALRDPEVASERRTQIAGSLLESDGKRIVVPYLAGEAGGAPLRVVDVALDLAGRDRSLRERAVGELDGVPAVLPALVDQAGERVAAFVLDVSVAVAIPAVLDPGQSCTGVWLQRPDEVVVAGPTVVLVEEDQEQGGGVRGSEVR